MFGLNEEFVIGMVGLIVLILIIGFVVGKPNPFEKDEKLFETYRLLRIGIIMMFFAAFFGISILGFIFCFLGLVFGLAVSFKGLPIHGLMIVLGSIGSIIVSFYLPFTTFFALVALFMIFSVFVPVKEK